MDDLKKIQKSLEDKLLELNNRIEDIEEDLRKPNDDDWSEDASESQGDEAQEGVENITMGEISKIKSALSKIKSGTYGSCEECGEKISLKRLQALPYAIQCVGCSSLDG